MDQAEFMRVMEREGEVPPVEVADLKGVWKLTREVASKFNGQQVIMGMEMYQSACHPGADAHAVWYRSAMLETLKMMAGPMKLPAWMNDEPNDTVFQVLATFPMSFLKQGAPSEGLPFDVEEFLKVVEKAAPGIS